jgi:hypothetical protein
MLSVSTVGPTPGMAWIYEYVLITIITINQPNHWHQYLNLSTVLLPQVKNNPENGYLLGYEAVYPGKH